MSLTYFREKVCVFFTLLLLNLSLAAPRKFGKYLNGDSILCMDSFSRHMRAGLFICCVFIRNSVLLYFCSSYNFLVLF
jgi:hypothetical protein